MNLFKKAGNMFRGLGKKVRKGVDAVRGVGKKVMKGAEELGVGDVLRKVGREATETAKQQLGGMVGEKGQQMINKGMQMASSGGVMGRNMVQRGVRQLGGMASERLRRMRR